MVLLYIFVLLVLIVFVTPWLWLKRAMGVLAAMMAFSIAIEEHFTCSDWGCGLAIALGFMFWGVVGVICLMRVLVMQYLPSLAMARVGTQWLWLGDFCVAAAGGNVVGLLVFAQLIWAFAGEPAAEVHLGLVGVIFMLLGAGVAVYRQVGVVASGIVLGVALMLAGGTVQSLRHPNAVWAAAEKHVLGGPFCIYFPQSDRFSQRFDALTLLTMEKSTDGYKNRHAFLVWNAQSGLKTAYWSFRRKAFLGGHQSADALPPDLKARFRSCLARG